MGRMTAKEVRDVGFVAWSDPWAWMENMKGKRWENLIMREKAHYNDLALQAPVKRLTRQMEQEILDAQQYMLLEGFTAASGAVDIVFHPIYGMSWKWKWNKKIKPMDDFDVLGNVICYVTSYKNMPYDSILICENAEGKRLWEKKNVTSDIAIVGHYCYYIKTVGKLDTSELCMCDLETGRQNKCIYKEVDDTKYIQLIKGANRALYLQSSDKRRSSLYRIKGAELISLHKRSFHQIPLGESIDGEDCVLTQTAHLEPWVAHGAPVKDWILPKEDIQWVNINLGHVITIHEGEQTIWYCMPRRKPTVLYKIKAGVIDTATWLAWEFNLTQTYYIKCPDEPPYMIDITNHTVTRRERPHDIPHPVNFPTLECHRFHAASKDGTKVPYVMIKQEGVKIKAQYIYVYGAYGSTTPVNWPYQSWYPLLSRGWAIIFAMVRGGGDVDAAWAEAARKENRHVSVDDFEAVIRASQHKLKLTPDKTVIYGRSAGGLPIGAIVARFPNGELVGAAFTEVPYVDVLRTSSNPDLPLTKGEYEEFGNPSEKILDFKELLTVSPINSLSSDGAPGVFVMSRVGLLDEQVYAYESFKWIQRLRGAMSPDDAMIHPKGKYVTFEKDEAHVYKPKRFPRFHAIDMAILDTWVNGDLQFA